MSTYSKQTKHPVTGEWHEATWIDDYYGRHIYGIEFPDGEMFNADRTKLETRDDEPVTHTEKILAKFEKWEIHQNGCAFRKTSKWFFYACDMNCKNVFEGQLSTSITQALAEDRERVRGEIEKNELGLYSGDVKSIVDLLSSLDTLTDNK